LVATADVSNNDKPALFRCNLDGTSCAYTDISAGAGTESGTSVLLAIDTANSKMLAVTADGSNRYRLSLFRCNLDGTSCTHMDISAGAGATSGFAGSLAIDAANGAFLVVTQDNSNFGKPAVFRCNLDGTACMYFDFSGGAGQYSGTNPSLAIEPTTHAIAVVTQDGSNSSLPALFLLP
jgi:hypothetical protein